MPTIGTVTLQSKQSRLSKELESEESKASFLLSEIRFLQFNYYDAKNWH
jgi:hypothetical protein